MCSSPDPARVVSPVSSRSTFRSGSDFDSLVSPFWNFGISAGFLGFTATLNTGATEYFIDLMGCDTGRSMLVIVPVLSRQSSIPVKATMFPQGMSGKASGFLPIMKTPTCPMLFSQSSVFWPTLQFDPRILTFCPDLTVPEKMRPKAANLPPSMGTILEMQMQSGPQESQLAIALKTSSSLGPSQRQGVLYFWATAGDGKCSIMVSRRQSAAGNHLLITIFPSSFPSSFLSCWVRLIFSFSINSSQTSFSCLAMALDNLQIGSMTNLAKPLWSRTPFSLCSSVCHFLVSSSQKLSPHIFFMKPFAVSSFLLQSLAMVAKLKAHWSFPAPKTTFPLVGSRRTSSSFSSWQVEMTTLTLSITFENLQYISSGLSLSSWMALSTLLIISTGLIFSCMACRSTVSVCTHTPSTASTTTRAPSVTRRAAVTSELKSTWPGESMRFIKYSSSFPQRVCRQYMDTPVDLMVIPLSISSSLWSRDLAFPATFSDIMPALATRASERVLFPWSTCAMTEMFRMFWGQSMIFLTSSMVNLTIRVDKDLILKTKFNSLINIPAIYTGLTIPKQHSPSYPRILDPKPLISIPIGVSKMEKQFGGFWGS